jgi:ribosomal protein L16 Arg81 hydroxylase
LLAAGASIIFNWMESFSYPIRALSQELARYVGHDTAANGYISIGGDQAFGNHWDTHDVFAVQLIGQKH